MKAKLLSVDGDDVVLKVDTELYHLISPQAGLAKAGEELRLHDYVPRAMQYSHALGELKKALTTLFKLSTEW